MRTSDLDSGLVELGVSLKNRRQALGRSLADVAREAGISSVYLWILESGHNPRTEKPSRPSLRVLTGLVRALSIEDESIFELAGYSAHSHAGAAGGGSPRVFRVPRARNRYFVGRRSLLRRLRKNLARERVSPQVIVGMPGVGKTQLALEYINQCQQDYEVVWWARGERPDTLTKDLTDLAIAVGVSETSGGPGTVPYALDAWLRENRHWLIVLDNVEPNELVGSLLPQECHGHFLLTSRDPNWQTLGQVVPVDVLPIDHAVEFITARTGSRDVLEASKLAEAVGCLPLALEQAGAYIEQRQISMGDYTGLLEHRRTALLAAAKPVDYRSTVSDVLTLTLNRVAEESQQAEALLTLMAYLAPDDIPRQHILDGMTALVDAPLTLPADDWELDEAIAVLRRFSLVDVTPTDLAVHRLVQDIARGRVGSADRVWAAYAFAMLLAVFHKHCPADPHAPDPGDLEGIDRLLPHYTRARDHIDLEGDNGEDLGFLDRLVSANAGRGTGWAEQVLASIGAYEQARGRPSQSEQFLQDALNGTDAAAGEQRARVLTDLGIAQFRGGDTETGRKNLEEGLRLREDLSLRHPGLRGADLPHSHLALGNLHRESGRHGLAREHYERALELLDRESDARRWCAAKFWLADLDFVSGELAKSTRRFDVLLNFTYRAELPEMRGRIFREFGHIACAREQFGSAVEQYRSSFEVAERLNHQHQLSEACIGLGWALIGTDTDEAKQHIHRAREIAEDAGIRLCVGKSLCAEALLLLVLRENDAALDRAEAASDLLGGPYASGSAYARLLQAEADFAREHFDSAFTRAIEALAYYKGENVYPSLRALALQLAHAAAGPAGSTDSSVNEIDQFSSIPFGQEFEPVRFDAPYRPPPERFKAARSRAAPGPRA